MKTVFSEPQNDDFSLLYRHYFICHNEPSINDLKPAEPTTLEVIIVKPNDVQSEQLYIVSIDICQDNVDYSSWKSIKLK